MTTSSTRRSRNRSIGWALVGLGHISQSAVLPAFANAGRNSRLVALVSGESKKARALAKAYGVRDVYSYDDYDECLANPDVDAVYVALPNNLHAEFTVRAARAGVHVLCEKPMAIDEAQCQSMIRATRDYDVKLMIAYRLHFEEANLRAVDLVRSGRLGEPRLFESSFGYQVQPGNIRLERELGGGAAWDIGIYCLNAARYLFQDEPTEVSAFSSRGRDRRFAEVEEGLSALLRFPGERLATFNCSFGIAPVAQYRVVGTKGILEVQNAYEYSGERRHVLTVGEKTSERVFAPVDQFGPELEYFADCVLQGREPEPNGWEGLADVRILRALYRAAEAGKAIKIAPVARSRRPTGSMAFRRPAVKEKKLVEVEAPAQ